uniref:Modification methylase n=1 Tax=Siphoviridae sp. ctzWr28 TaxID=2827980 RepID=A0A8S5SC63_9CAUD|nr:MAG TPA: Putative modification methylase [Siphoviridae sp. ctzWr28]
MKIEKISIDKIKMYENNAKEHPNWQIEKLSETIKKIGYRSPIIVDENNMILAGHGRYMALKKLGYSDVQVVRHTDLTEEDKKAYMIADNQYTLNTGFNMEILKQEIEELESVDFNTSLLGFDEIELQEIMEIEEELLTDKYGSATEEQKGNLESKFIIPPFSIIDANKSPWLDIKNKWKELFDSSKGRDKSLIDQNYGTSVFDGAICEVFYKWYTPQSKEIKVLDPFSGGCVRGAVAELLGFKYTGFDIREEQTEQNKAQAKELKISPVFITDDSENVDKYVEDNTQDLIFSCPPYLDLEVYSDNENDLSNMEYEQFKDKYNRIIKNHCNKLKENRFAIFVVGDVRDKKGKLIDFVGDTIEAFEKAGLNYYNQVIYREPVGSAAIRAGRAFNISRKITKIHQNILIFYKGDVTQIKNHFKEFYSEEDLKENEDE